MREVVVRTAQEDSDHSNRGNRLVKLLATGLERLLSDAAQDSEGTPSHVDLSGSLSPNRHAPDEWGQGEHAG